METEVLVRHAPILLAEEHMRTINEAGMCIVELNEGLSVPRRGDEVELLHPTDAEKKMRGYVVVHQAKTPPGSGYLATIRVDSQSN